MTTEHPVKDESMTLLDVKTARIMLEKLDAVQPLTYVTISPPQITLRYLLMQGRFYISMYRNEHLPILTIIQFMLLRLFQRVAYNLGWHKSKHSNSSRLRIKAGDPHVQ